MSAALDRRAVAGAGSVDVLRAYLTMNEEVAHHARARLTALQSQGNESSRTGYLRSLSDIIGRGSGPAAALEEIASSRDPAISWRALWMENWHDMYMEHKGISAPPEGWDEAVFGE